MPCNERAAVPLDVLEWSSRLAPFAFARNDESSSLLCSKLTEASSWLAVIGILRLRLAPSPRPTSCMRRSPLGA